MANDCETWVCLLTSRNRTISVGSKELGESAVQSKFCSFSELGWVSPLGPHYNRPCAELLESLPWLTPYYPSDPHVDSPSSAVFFLIPHALD